MGEDARNAWMDRALELARRGWGRTHPNPMVGALIVEGGEIVAEGWHERAGEAHAEVRALQALGRRPREGAILVVTLEPCCTHGRTPPCTEAILEAGLRRLVVGATDPNPAHAGRGLDILQAAGVEVTAGVRAEDCRDVNLIFEHVIVRQTPLVAGKLGLTLDGKIATRGGHSRFVTGEAARADVMRWRHLFPAIGAGSGTVLADDPRLTRRSPGEEEGCGVRLIFDRRGRTLEAEPLPGVYRDGWADRTILVMAEPPEGRKAEMLARTRAGLWVTSASAGSAFWQAVRARLGEAGLTGLLLEGGGQLLSDALEAEELDYLLAYTAPKILGDAEARAGFRGLSPETMSGAVTLSRVRHEVFPEGDVLTRGWLPGRG